MTQKNKSAVRQVLDKAKAEGRTSLTAPEGKLVCDAYGIPVPKEGVATSADEAAKLASTMGFPVVLKIVSPQILHKTEAGGVLVGVDSADAARKGFDTIMGISQHVHGTDNARCLIALSLVTGQVGRPGTGLHPLRGQNNVQGASDAGLIPMVYPDYRSVEAPEIRTLFEDFWGVKLDPKRGLTVVEIMMSVPPVSPS